MSETQQYCNTNNEQNINSFLPEIDVTTLLTKSQQQHHEQQLKNNITTNQVNFSSTSPIISTIPTTPISQLKSNASMLNQQLLLSIITNSTTTTNISTSTLEIIKMLSRFEQHCDQFALQQSYFNQQQLNFKQEQLEFKQKQLNFELDMKQQQQKIEQQVFDLQCERREFELTKRESQLFQQHISTNNNHNNNHHQQQHIASHSPSCILNNSNINSSISHNDISKNNNNSTTHNNHNNDNDNNDNDVNQIQLTHILHDVHQDYQAMKYLVEQSITTQQLFQQQYAILNQKMNGVEQLETQTVSKLNKIDRIESQLHQLQQTTTALSNQSSQFEQRFISIETNYQPNASTIAASQREKVPVILKTNRKLKKRESEYIAFQFVNFPDVQCSCGHWGNASFRFILYDCLIENIFPSKLKPLLSTIQLSKLFISTKSVLDGEWIQIQGDGKIIDINDIEFHDLLKPGDDICQYSDYPCKSCEGYNHNDDSTTKRFLIKIKWKY